MSIKKKVLFIYAKNLGEPYNRKSAIGSYINELSKLLENNFEVTINGNYKRDEIVEKRVIQKQHLFRKLIVYFLSKIGIKEIKNFFTLKKQHNALFKELLKENYDLVFEVYTIYSTVGAELSKTLNVPLVTLYDGPVMEEYEFFNGKLLFFKSVLSSAEMLTLNQSKSIILYSKPVSKFIQAQVLKSEVTKINIHQNVDFSRYVVHQTSDFSKGINFMFMGSFLKWHNAENVVIAFRKIQPLFPEKELKLYMVGDGQEKKRIEQLANVKSEHGDVTFTGFLDGDALEEIKNKCHVGVMPSSNWYGAPNKIFEYAAAGLKVIAPKTPTIFDTFENYTGIEFITNSSVEELKKQMIKVIENPKIAQLEAKGFQKLILRNYSKEITKSFYAEVFNQALIK